ncbi:ribonuclease T2-like [Rosa chinensis]|uniref:ribonuclease T2-like n=1 Tax=Rosa chinensis TaxID=74649 RepID=UPI001AD94561|nr:ribonuclease T2-like [Rosa chinensis]
MDDSTLNGKKDDLNKYWPDLTHSKFEESKSFWIHEWEKHGRCSAKSPANYLSLVFDLMKKHDVEQIFKDNGILPSKNGYPMTQLGQLKANSGIVLKAVRTIQGVPKGCQSPSPYLRPVS